MKTVIVMVLLCSTVFRAESNTGKISTVFVDGSNEAAQKIRKEISKGKLCLTLSPLKSGADSILEVAENRQGWPYSIKISGTLSSKSGEVIWSGTRGAAEGLLWDMKKAVCSVR